MKAILISSVMKSSLLKSPPVRTLSASALKLRLLKKLHCTLRFEKKAWQSGARLVAGVDEVGRGSLFGCVVAGAVILDPTYRIRGLRDSKLLLAERREVLAQRIREHGPSPLHRQSFAPVWQNPIPQEAFAFVDEEAAQDAIAEVEVVQDLAG